MQRVPLLVCVDKCVQTDDVRDVRVSMHVEARLLDRKCVRSALRNIGAAVPMHKGKDGHVRQLCGPGIAPVVRGRAPKVRLRVCEAPISVVKKKKKKDVALQFARVW